MELNVILYGEILQPRDVVDHFSETEWRKVFGSFNTTAVCR